MIACPVCDRELPTIPELADHLWDAAEASEGRHVMWLNRHVGMREVPRNVLRERLTQLLPR